MAKNLNVSSEQEVHILSMEDDDSDLTNPDNSVVDQSSAPSAPPVTSSSSGHTYSFNPSYSGLGDRGNRFGMMSSSSAPTPPVVMMTAITPRVYTGLESEDPKEWLDHYELVCKSNNWNNDLKMNRVVTALAGHALTWYMSWMKDHQVHRWDFFRRDLLMSFGIQKPERFHLTKLINRERMPNESPRHYAMEMKKIADKCGGQFSTKQLIGIILKGINDQKLFSSLYCREFDDFEDFMRRLALHSEGNQFLSSKAEPQVLAVESMNRRLIPQSQNTKTSRFQDNRSDLRCFYCNRPGHMVRDCRTLQRERSPRFRQNNGSNNNRNGTEQHEQGAGHEDNNRNRGQVFQSGFSRRQNSPQTDQQSNLRTGAKTFFPRNQSNQ